MKLVLSDCKVFSPRRSYQWDNNRPWCGFKGSDSGKRGNPGVVLVGALAQILASARESKAAVPARDGGTPFAFPLTGGLPP